ncbi:MAG TPA: hypothetical protein VF178_04255 [Gemmatimonadaceae bacterium]
MPNDSDTADRRQGKEGQRRSGGGRAPTHGAETSRWEFVVGGIGALLVAGAIGSMLVEAVRAPEHPVPVLMAEVDTVHRTSSGWVAAVTVENGGEATAAEVEVEGMLYDETGMVEASRVTLDYVPVHSRREAGLFFTRDPAGYRLVLRPLGFRRP